MKKPQIITIVIAALAMVLLLAFGRTAFPPKQHTEGDGHDHADHAAAEAATSAFSIDSAINLSKKELQEAQVLRLELLEKSITRGDVKEQQLNVYHQLAHFWKDTARSFIPYAWYTAEAARLENSEKSLTFAAQLFLNQLQQVDNGQIKLWMTEQAKDLFEKVIAVNPRNDSAKVSLGATLLYGGAGAPMEAIAKIREVADRDSNNVYAQMTLANASLVSGQKERAIDRLQKVLRIQPENIQALLMLGDLYEKEQNKEEAVKLYTKALGFIKRDDIRRELEKRIAELKK